MPSLVGELLREWRAARRVSQLGLALAADVSPRHLSYVENGRSQPSRDLIVRLTEALDVPMRDRNALLIAAGFAPAFRETELSAPEMSRAKRAVELMLKQQEPYPAIVVNRHYDLMMRNQGAARVFGWLLGGPAKDRNIMRLTFDPNAMRPLVANWDQVAVDLLRQLYLDDGARDVLREVLAYPGIPSRWRTDGQAAPALPFWTIAYRKDGRELTFFWTLTTFGTPQDVTLQELRIESWFPADDATDQFCRQLAQNAGDTPSGSSGVSGGNGS